MVGRGLYMMEGKIKTVGLVKESPPKGKLIHLLIFFIRGDHKSLMIMVSDPFFADFPSLLRAGTEIQFY